MEVNNVKKTAVTVLLVIVIVLSLVVAGALGFLWYRENHIFVEGTAYAVDSASLDLREEDISIAHYNTLRSQLPDCQILWNVPFQGSRYSNETESLSVSTLTEADVELLMNYFPKLKKVDASQCHDYGALEILKAQLPDLEVVYQVSLGGKSFAPDTTELVLEVGDYDYVTMTENLLYLPQVQSIKLRTPELTLQQVEDLRAAYPEIEITCTVEIFRVEYDTETTELDLSAMTGDDAAVVAEQLAMLPNLTYVNLNPENGVGALSKADVKTLMEAVPDVVFDFTFDFYGTQVSTADEEVIVKNTNIGDEGQTEVRLALDLLKNCKRFVLDNCKLSNEVMAQIREDYREQTKVVWRVYFGKGSSLTDAEILRAVYDLVDNNCHDLVYCEDVRYMDIGHNEWLDAVDFIAGMPNLEYVIISGSPVKSLEPFRNCKKLKVLEAAFCEYLESAEPLSECESLEMLNISYTHITDLSPLDNLNLTHLCAKYYPKSRVSQEEQDRWTALKPDCWSQFVGSQPYGAGWRYTTENEELEWYAHIREVFRYDIYPNTPNHVGWYLD